MLVKLNIRNFALIEHIQLHFEDGFTVFTGETGSGKSILLGALNLILGERAAYSVLRDEHSKTVVEAVFNLKAYQLEDFFAANDLDFFEESIIRREISNQGKSRAFVNDTPVQLATLKELAEKLIHIHSQHHTLELKSSDFQLDVLDYLSDSYELRKEFKKKYLELKRLKNLKAEKTALLNRLNQEEDYINFQLNELQKLNLKTLRYDALEQELTELEQFDVIKETFAAISVALNGEYQLVEKLVSLNQILERNKHIHSSLESFSERIKSVSLEIQDIASESEDILENLQENPARKMELEQILSAYNAALMKHRLTEQSELIEILGQFEKQNSSTSELNEELAELERQIQILENEIRLSGEALHQRRSEHKGGIEQKLVAVLAELKMENCLLDFAVEKTDSPNESGFTKLNICFSPNPGIPAKAIDKIASGGELSRLMLAIQLLLSEKKMLPTLIFDEIDTGVSGEVAQKLGKLLNRMGKQLQLMAITHLPQVAAQGNQHFQVIKLEKDQISQTDVQLLNQDQRILEIARLMSGENINESALQHARELMN